MQKELYYVIIGIALCVVILSISAFSVYKKVSKDTQNPVSKNTQSPKINENLYIINDDSLGISFQINKLFNRIDQQTLSQTNPYFVYGFKPKDVTDVSCFISQTKRTGSGSVSVDYLKNGTLAEIKKNYPNLVVDNSKKIKLGDVEGAYLDITYKDQDKEFKQIEIIGTTDIYTTFAFCSTPKSLYDFYKPKIDEFINSFQIK